MVYGNGDSDLLDQDRHEEVTGLLRSIVDQLKLLQGDFMDLIGNRTPKGYVPIETYHATIKTLIWAFAVILMAVLGMQNAEGIARLLHLI